MKTTQKGALLFSVCVVKSSGILCFESTDVSFSLLFIRMFLSESVWSFTYILIKSSVERLTVGESHHCTNLFHVLVLVTLVNQKM